MACVPLSITIIFSSVMVDVFWRRRMGFTRIFPRARTPLILVIRVSKPPRVPCSKEHLFSVCIPDLNESPNTSGPPN